MRHLHFLFILAAALFGVGNAWADSVTVTQSSFSDASSGTIGGDANVTYETGKGGGTSVPAVYSDAIRLYQLSSSSSLSYGGYITISLTNEDLSLTSVTIGSSMATYVSYSFGSTVGEDLSEAEDLSADGTFTVSDFEDGVTSITFYCMGTSSSTRLYVNYLSVTYEGDVSQSSAALAFSTTSDNVYEEELSSYNAPTFTYATTADITFSSDNEEVATVDALGIVSLTGTRGTAVITATSEANDDYYAGSATYTVTVYGYKTYKKTTTIVDGSEYLIVVKDDSYTYYAYPLSSSYTYGYLYVGTISGDVDEISVKTLYEDGFIIASVDGGYSIKDVDTERYYCQSGTYSSFQIASDAEAWTIEQQDDGTYKISMNDYYIQYSTSYSSYGIYSDEQGLMPYLYIIDTDYIASAVDEVAADAEPKVYAADGKLYVDAAEGALIEVYDLNGRRIAQTTAATSNTVIDGIATGQLLIVRVDGRATKLLF